MTVDEALTNLRAPRDNTPMNFYHRLIAHAVLLDHEARNGPDHHHCVLAAALSDICAKLASDV